MEILLGEGANNTGSRSVLLGSQLRGNRVRACSGETRAATNDPEVELSINVALDY